MQIDIKCSECGKGTRNFELGAVYYNPQNPSETILIEKEIICPKCNKDISDEKCMIKHKYLLMIMVAANISLLMKVEDGLAIPKHLMGVFPLNEDNYEIMKQRAKSKPRLVEKF